MFHIKVNDLKTIGIAAIEAVLAEQTEAIVLVGGQARFVVMDLAQMWLQDDLWRNRQSNMWRELKND